MTLRFNSTVRTHRCRSRQIFWGAKDFCRIPQTCLKSWATFVRIFSYEDRFWDDLRKRSSCASANVGCQGLGAIFACMFREFVHIFNFQGFCQGFHRFCPYFLRFCPDFQEYLLNQNFWGVLSPPPPTPLRTHVEGMLTLYVANLFSV